MAKAEQIKALIRSHAERDDTRFYAIAMQVAAQAARSGHSRFAQELRELVDRAKERIKGIETEPSPKPIPMAQPRGELAGLVTAAYPKTRVADMALEDDLAQRIGRVLLEQRQRHRLREHGFAPLRKLLLVGPPGTGKTMTASALAGELGLPLFTIQLDGLITKYMGETAAKLRLVFDAIQATRGTYLFDEFDALGAQRSGTNDVGEIRRVLNSFLQFLEQDDSDSIIIGATNHVGLLDRALFRRFDAVFEYSIPSRAIAM
ncbi:MAG: ATP-binding protein, partial [Gammaproteobacteria bacterium]